VIYLVPEFKSSIGDDTFWTWFKREFPSEYDPPDEVSDSDRILQYAMLGPSKVKGGKKVACLWELYPELQRFGLSDKQQKIDRMHACYASSELKTVSSRALLDYYPNATVLPIGVDTDLFRPRNKEAMRLKHRIPLDRKVGFWAGTNHPMKGVDRKAKYQKENPDVFWITVFKDAKLTQQHLSELMSCADFGLFTSRLRPYFMTEWEMMACNLPIVDISGMERDFVPSAKPRDDVFYLGWDRQMTKRQWAEFLQ
jgi:glycosyltransferase involved in cell wall biosynthesis